MGLLDDAIREHLELKRRHGADPEEVSRQEREALGAPARGEFAQPGAVAAEEAAEPAAEDAPSEVEAELQEPPEPPGESPPVEPEPGGYEGDPWLADPEEDEPPASVAAPPEDVVAPDEEEPAGEDVLEETPEFLQETPEHDRLWFEQKPPRDFDWDK